MLTTKDLENALKKNYVDFSEAVKAVLTEKLDNHPVIKSKMDEIEQYDSITEKCDEMVCKKHDDEKEDEPLDDEDEKEEKDSDDDDDDEDSDDDSLDESLSYEKGKNYLIPLRQTRGRRLRLKLKEKETLEGKLEDFDEKYIYLGKTRCLPDDYWIDGMGVPWKNIISAEFIKETGRRIF